ncbi:Winged helix-turn-helix DNA-binding domain containing protein [Trema orientale]|uniref:Winged helix-turn-helix DNA-binding domain containing protein n=1 Tax=Trema orientale TaxID=63057 RepID=A0A2P5CLH0_TREOI|nr:Winged helix-turn-helix DNA-binding domain containing protein [Trema orientale]
MEDSELMKVSKKKEFREFSEASTLDNEVSHGGNGVQKSFNLDSKPRYEYQKLSFDLLSNGAEQEPQNNKTKHDAEKLVVKLLATRALTAVELRKKLCGRRFSPDVEEVINDFKRRCISSN